MLIESEEMRAWAKEWRNKTACCGATQASYEHMLTKIAELEQKQGNKMPCDHEFNCYECAEKNSYESTAKHGW